MICPVLSRLECVSRSASKAVLLASSSTLTVPGTCSRVLSSSTPRAIVGKGGEDDCGTNLGRRRFATHTKVLISNPSVEVPSSNQQVVSPGSASQLNVEVDIHEVPQ